MVFPHLQDTQKAFLLAARGRQFSRVEEAVRSFIYFHNEQYRINAGFKPSQFFKMLEEIMSAPPISPENRIRLFAKISARALEPVVKVFVQAMRDQDSDKIMEIARAVEFLKFYKEEGDRYRAKILKIKVRLDKTGDKLSIRKLAIEIKWPLSDASDGFSSLRRICRQLKFPLAASRQIGLK